MPPSLRPGEPPWLAGFGHEGAARMLPAVNNGRQRLSIGSPPVQKAFGVAFGLLFATAGAAFALLPFVVDGWLQRAFTADESCPTSAEISGIPPEMLPQSVRDCVA